MRRIGFSLIELSIVLVILGLLTGGILAGQSLIRAAETRALMNDVVKYRTATWAFRDKYFQLPGDLNNAVRFWGAATGGTADGVDSTCAATTTASTDARTCNGNGDGAVCVWTGGLCHELNRYWQYLANAGLIEGKFSGVGLYGPGGGNYAGKNAPVMRIPLSTFAVRQQNAVSESSNDYALPITHLYYLGLSTNPNGSEPFGPIVTPQEAWNIDTKTDDGRPGLGFVRSYKNGTAHSWLSEVNACTTAGAAGVAAYDLTQTTKKCAFMILWN